ncbi:MAG: SURF1 family protein [Rhizobiaceae bacterium]
MSMRRRAVVLLAAFPVFLALLGLGAWQVQRLQWKQGLIAAVDARIASPPRPLDDVLASGEDVDYRPVTVSGTFAHSGERHFFSTFRGETGFQLFTPLDRGGHVYVFVNRGFVPYDRKDPATRAEGQVAGPVTVTGFARAVLAGKPGRFLPDNDPSKNMFYWKDLDAMATSAGLPADATVLPLFIDAGPAPNAGGLPVGGTTIVEFPNSHLQYAVTWFGLALALALVTGAFLWRARP